MGKSSQIFHVIYPKNFDDIFLCGKLLSGTWTKVSFFFVIFGTFNTTSIRRDRKITIYRGIFWFFVDSSLPLTIANAPGFFVSTCSLDIPYLICSYSSQFFLSSSFCTTTSECSSSGFSFFHLSQPILCAMEIIEREQVNAELFLGVAQVVGESFLSLDMPGIQPYVEERQYSVESEHILVFVCIKKERGWVV